MRILTLAVAAVLALTATANATEPELAIVNDTNFGSTGRNAGLPDYSDFIVVEVPRLG